MIAGTIINITWNQIRENIRISGTEMPCHKEGKVRKAWCIASMFIFVRKMHIISKNTGALFFQSLVWSMV
jgi:hypothetical protein